MRTRGGGVSPPSVEPPSPPSPAASPPRLTVVVLSYNSARFLAGCLDALGRSRGVELEIICVDNASGDESHAIAEGHPAVAEAIRSERNLGYSGGNNLGWRRGSAPHVVFINPDCHVQPWTLARLVAPLGEDPAVGATGAVLLYPNTRRIQHAGGILHPNAMCEHHHFMEVLDEAGIVDRDCDYVTGALIAFHRADLERLGGFDEDYWPAYYEETDLCLRLRREGRLVRLVAQAVAYHWESPGLTKLSPRFVRTSYRSRIRFVIKNFTIGEFLGGFLPFELRWLAGPFARGFRLATLRSYLSGAGFAFWCLLRLSRHPQQRSSKPGSSHP